MNNNDKIGSDFKLEGDYDLALTAEGQLELLKGYDVVSSAIIRRISTDFSGYERMVRTGETTVTLNSTYGSSLNALLSSPITVKDEMLETVAAAARLDGRVSIEEAYLSSDNREDYLNSTVSLEITYRLLPQYRTSTSGDFKQLRMPIVL